MIEELGIEENMEEEGLSTVPLPPDPIAITPPFVHFRTPATPAPSALDTVPPELLATLSVDANFMAREAAQDVPAAPTVGFGQTVLPRSHGAPAGRSSAARFLPQRSLGKGASGEVISVLDQDIGRPVAVKRLRADRMSPGAQELLIEEIRTIGRLEHANIVPIHDVGRDADGSLYFIMREVRGETLEVILGRLRAGDPETHRKFGFERRLQIGVGVLEALAFAHAQGVVHRDVKPANIMVGPYGEVYLLDWGIARSIAAHAGVSGTPAYMSPEQAAGAPADPAADVYALCVVLQELMTLQPRFADAPAMGDLDQALARVRAYRPTQAFVVKPPVAAAGQGAVPTDISWLLFDGLHPDLARRYPTAQALLDRIARRAEGDIPVQCAFTLTHRLSSRALRVMDNHPVAATLGALGLMADLFGAVQALFG
jgi:serine/threonine-protein kinase